MNTSTDTTPQGIPPFLLKPLRAAASLKTFGINFLRVAIFIVFAWIGGLKVAQYEADGIVPFVANSPFMSFFYNKEAPEYKAHMNKEGQVVPENIAWHQSNNTYGFSYGLGAMIVSIGLLTLLGLFSPKIGIFGDLLVIVMTAGTLSFLITTPEVWVPDLGGPNHGFPYLTGAGRLVIKDIAMMAGAFILLATDAGKILAGSSRSLRKG